MPHSKPSPQRRDIAGFIRANLTLQPVRTIPEIWLYTAHSGSGLWRLADPADPDPPPPYWAYPWAGGAVLARHLLDHPDTVAGKRVLDLGAGGGIVAIAAAKAGARSVAAAEIDPHGLAALALNAEANDVAVAPIAGDLTAGAPPPDCDLIALGDLFYNAALATRVLPFLDRCLAASVPVLVGDPGRADLPLARLRPLARYTVFDFGDGERAAGRDSAVYALEPASHVTN